MPFSDSAAPPRLDCSACALPHDRLARARAGSPSRCSSLRPPPLLFAACQGSRLVDVVGLSASHVQCSSAGCDACVRFPTDSACSVKVSLPRPRVRVRSSSPSVESVRRVRSSGPLVVFSSTSCLAWLSSHCAPTYMVTFLDVSVCDLADLACVGQTSAAAGRMRFRASLFRRYSAPRGMAWTPRALLPGDALRFFGASDHSLVCLEAPPSSAFLNAWTFFCERKPNMATLSGVCVLRLTRRERLASLPSQVGWGARRTRGERTGVSLNETHASAYPLTATSSRESTAAPLTARRNSSARLRCAPATPDCKRRQQLATLTDARCVRTCGAVVHHSYQTLAWLPQRHICASMAAPWQEERTQPLALTPP